MDLTYRRVTVQLKSPDRFDRQFVTWIAVGPVAIAALLAIVLGIRFQSAWGLPMIVFSGLALLLLAGRELTIGPHVAIVYALAVLILFPPAYLAVAWTAPFLGQNTHRITWPARAMAAAIDARWSKRSSEPLRYIVGDRWTAGLAALYSADRPSVMVEGSPPLSLWIDPERLRARGGVLVWQIGSTGPGMPAALAERFPQAVPGDPVVLRWPHHLPAPPIRLGWAYLGPEQE